MAPRVPETTAPKTRKQRKRERRAAYRTEWRRGKSRPAGKTRKK